MNWGNSSNCVHWLYAVVTGTPTSIDSSTIAIRTSSVEFRPYAPLPGRGPEQTRLAPEAVDQPPRAGKERGREIELDEIAGEERGKPLLERRQEVVVRNVCEPWEAEQVDDDVPGEH